MSEHMMSVLRGFTVIPLLRLNLDAGLSIPFGAEFVLRQTPEWVKRDALIQHLTYSDQQAVITSQYSFLADYEANAIGDPHPKSTKEEPRTVQSDKAEAGAMANLALWLVQPCAVCYTSVLHGLQHQHAGEERLVPILQQMETHTPLHCHPDDVEKQPTVEQIQQAGELFDVLRSISRGNAVWTAMRSVWAALVMPHRDIRYSLFWIGLEALFGPENSGGEIIYKLSQRIAFLISDEPSHAKEEFRLARECYQTRSQIAHGRWANDPKTGPRMADTEAIVRASVLRILQNLDLRATFCSTARDRFLEDMIFSPLWTVRTAD
jgi:hypothetical protein